MIVIMPMAGRGSRFRDAEPTRPKPLVTVAGRPMFVQALKSLGGDTDCRIIFVALQEHEQQFGIRRLIDQHVPNPSQLVLLADVTEGQLCTVLAAREHLQLDEDVLIMSSDTVVESQIYADIRNRPEGCAGIISTCRLAGEQWSFAETDSLGHVVRVAEKQRISDNASTGLYYFSEARTLLLTADRMIEENERTRGEFYVIPVYQKYIDCGYKISLSYASAVWDMGTPAAKAIYENHLSQN